MSNSIPMDKQIQEQEKNQNLYVKEAQFQKEKLKSDNFQQSRLEKAISLSNLQQILAQISPQLKHYLVDLKSKQCQHEFGCVDNLYMKTLRGFLWGYLGICGISMLQRIKRNNFSQLKNVVFSKEAFRFSLFLTLMNFTVNFIQCLGKNSKSNLSQKEKKKLAFISGSLGGLFALWSQPSKSRPIWAIFTLARAFDCILTNLVNKGKFPRFNHTYTVLMALINTLTVYSYACERGLVSPAISKFYDFVLNPDLNDYQHLHMQMRIAQKYCKEKGYNYDKDSIFFEMVQTKIDKLQGK